MITSITKKLDELRSTKTGRILYMYVDQGFPDHADVVIHPDFDAASLLAIPGVARNKRVEFRFGSNLRQFPERLNAGLKEEHFGRALYLFSEDAISRLCAAYEA